jgi:predicted nucleic acid-binding Zn ribbon protein
VDQLSKDPEGRPHKLSELDSLEDTVQRLLSMIETLSDYVNRVLVCSLSIKKDCNHNGNYCKKNIEITKKRERFLRYLFTKNNKLMLVQR